MNCCVKIADISGLHLRKQYCILETMLILTNVLIAACTQEKKIKLTCNYCGKEIERYPSDIEKNISGYFYCSRECGNRHKNQLRKESGEWAAGISNYRLRAMEVYEHKCLCCGWDEDDRILEAHHIDENRDNNHISNLCLLCPTCHRKITLGYYKLDVENKKLIKVKPC